VNRQLLRLGRSAMIWASSYITAFLAALALLPSILEAHADSRVALIIGNATYQNIRSDKNTVQTPLWTIR
jgi:hypothetical protein